MSNDVLIYGANGYTGRLIVKEAIAKGLRPILSGRNADAINAMGREFSLEARPAALDFQTPLDTLFEGVAAVIHCAGPFSRTAKVMADTCIRTNTHYLDITGEIAVFEMLAARSAEAARSGVMLLPGVGFDVVPSDCLAAHVHRRLTTATSLALGIHFGSSPSRGTATTMVENVGKGGAVRRAGHITKVAAAYKERDIDFGDRVRHCVTIPWGDVSTAFHSTAIPDIEVYMSSPPSQIRGMKLADKYGWLLASAPAQAFIKWRIHRGAAGPTEARRQASTARLYGEASDAHGRRVQSLLTTPEGYTLTALTAVASVQKVLSGVVLPGFQTPSRAFGADFILEIPGVTRLDIPEDHVEGRA
jgi:short subunit dehydrogenase-like uncharacterized protein